GSVHWRRAPLQATAILETSAVFARLPLSLETPSCGRVNLDLHRGAMVAVARVQHVERAVRQPDDEIHLGAELYVVPGAGYRLADDPAATSAVVLVVHEEVHRVRNVLGQQSPRRYRVADVLVTAVSRSETVRFVEVAVAHAVVCVVHALRLWC